MQIKRPILQNVTLKHYFHQKEDHSGSSSPRGAAIQHDAHFQNGEVGCLYEIPTTTSVNIQNETFCDTGHENLVPVPRDSSNANVIKEKTSAQGRKYDYLFISGGIDALSSLKTSSLPGVAQLQLDQMNAKVQFTEASWFANPYLEFGARHSDAGEYLTLSLNDRDFLLKFKKDMEVLLHELKMERRHTRKNRQVGRMGNGTPHTPGSNGERSRRRKRKDSSRGGSVNTPGGETDTASTNTPIDEATKPKVVEVPCESPPQKRRRKRNHKDLNLTPINTNHKRCSRSVSKPSQEGGESDQFSPESSSEHPSLSSQHSATSSPTTPHTPSQLTRFQSSSPALPGSAPISSRDSSLPPTVQHREVKRLKMELDSLTARLEQQKQHLQKEKDEVQQNLIIAQTRLKSANRRIEELNARNYDHEINRHKETIRAQDEELAQNKTTMEANQEDMKAYRVKVKELAQNLAESEENFASLKQAYKTQSKSMGHTEWKNRLKNQKEKFQGLMDRLQIQVKDSQSQCEMWKEKHDSAWALLDSEMAKSKQLTEERISAVMKVNTLENHCSALKEEIATMRAQMSQNSGEKIEHIQSLQWEIQTLNSQLHDEKSMYARLTKEKDDLEKVVNEKDEEIEQLRRDRDNANDTHSLAIGELMDRVHRLEGQLEKNDAEKESFVQRVALLESNIQKKVNSLSEEQNKHHETTVSLRDRDIALQEKEKLLKRLTVRFDEIQSTLNERQQANDSLKQQHAKTLEMLAHEQKENKNNQSEAQTMIHQLEYSLDAQSKKYVQDTDALKATISQLKRAGKKQEKRLEQHSAGNQLIVSRLRRQAQMAQSECNKLEQQVSELETQLRDQRELNISLIESLENHTSALEEYWDAIEALNSKCTMMEEESELREATLSGERVHAERICSQWQNKYYTLLTLFDEAQRERQEYAVKIVELEESSIQREKTLLTQHTTERDELRNQLQKLRKDQIEILDQHEAELKRYHQSFLSKKREETNHSVGEHEMSGKIVILTQQVKSLNEINETLRREHYSAREDLYDTRKALREVRNELSAVTKENCSPKQVAPASSPRQLALLEEQVKEMQHDASLIKKELEGERKKVAFWKEKATLVVDLEHRHEMQIRQLQEKIDELECEQFILRAVKEGSG
eukprot:CAMPEP_0117450308 /NCGR_PEP_ID=MMETSP0759-20121206/8398_1 /TAXON_ID=63605 /ORGANISM="Percolomonas cosmopolitus, Strain WS" /LENGTH=1146 /DNA_ID=CAMNT_0005242819 /DNA_START=204 /DNA_END=3644 /DNA_ORIENTATION=-